MPTYQVESNGHTYQVESDKELSDAEAWKYAQDSAPKEEAPKRESSALGAFGRALGYRAFPALATGVGGVIGGTLAGLVGAPSGPGAIATAAAGDIAVGTAAGAGAQWLQDKALGEAGVKEMEEQEKAGEAAHPTATSMGRLIPALLSSLGNPMKGGAGVAKEFALLRNGAKAGVGARLGETAIAGARMGGGEEAARQTQEGEFDPAKLAEAPIKSAITFAPTAFIPEAKSLLESVYKKAIPDAVAMALTNAVYDSVVHGKPIDTIELANQGFADIPGFVLLNLATGMLHGHPLLPKEHAAISQHAENRLNEYLAGKGAYYDEQAELAKANPARAPGMEQDKVMAQTLAKDLQNLKSFPVGSEEYNNVLEHVVRSGLGKDAKPEDGLMHNLLTAHERQQAPVREAETQLDKAKTDSADLGLNQTAEVLEKVQQKVQSHATETTLPTGEGEATEASPEDQDPAAPPEEIPQAKPKVVAAAVQWPDGNWHEGTNHPDILSSALGVSEGDPILKDRQARENPNFGFKVQDPDGKVRYVGREEALKIATDAGQLDGRKVERGQLHSDNLNMEDEISHDTKNADGEPLFDSKDEAHKSHEKNKSGDESYTEFLNRIRCQGRGEFSI